jgi:hypothetical protein
MQIKLIDGLTGEIVDIKALLKEPWAAQLAGEPIDLAISGEGRAVLITKDLKTAVSWPDRLRTKIEGTEGAAQFILSWPEESPTVRFPGMFWVALILFVVEWLPKIVSAPWIPDALVILLAVAKAIEVIVTRPGAQALSTDPAKQLTVGIARWLF